MTSQEIQKLFQRKVETGSIKEPEVNEKLVETSILKKHSLKAVVLKLLRRMTEEHVGNLEPPVSSSEAKKKSYTSSTYQNSESDISVELPLCVR